MALIEIQDGIVLNTDSIEGLIKLSDGNTQINTHHRKYLAKMPIETVTAILKGGEMEDRRIGGDEAVKNTMAKLDQVLNTRQHFAG